MPNGIKIFKKEEAQMKSRSVTQLNQSKISTIRSLLRSQDIQDMLLERSKNAALALGVELLEEDVRRLCGEPYSWKRDELYCKSSTFLYPQVNFAQLKYRIMQI
jgi:hypothetical protein